VTTTFHDCAVPECGRRIPVSMRLCAICWRKLPYKFRDELRDTVVGHNNGTVSAADVAAAVSKAVAAVEGGVR